MNGALGRLVYGFSETSETRTSAARRAFAMPVAATSSSAVALAFVSVPSSAKSRPVATLRPSTPVRRAVKRFASASGVSSASTSQ